MQDEYSRLNHANKIFSKSNWQYILNVCSNNVNSFVSPILTLDLTNRCNYNCRYCVDKNIVNSNLLEREIPWNLLKRLLQELKTKGCRCIEVTGGGEPTLYSYFEDFFDFCLKMNYRMALVTNGSLLYKNVEIFSKSNIDWIRISLDSSNSKTYNSVHGINSDIFSQILKSAEHIAKYVNLGVSFIILLENYNEIYDSAKLAKNIGAKYFELKPLLVSESKEVAYYNPEVIDSIMEQINMIKLLQNDEFKIVYPKSLSNCLIKKNDDNLKEYLVCRASYLRTVLTSSGVYACSYFRDISNKTKMPITVEELLELRNSSIQKINPSTQCLHFCARHEINCVLYDIIKMKDIFPNLLSYMGWPVDYGEDVIWL